MKGGHDVPITKIISRYERAIGNMATIIPIADRAYLYDNSRDNQEAQLLFRSSDGILTKQYTDSLPDWALQIHKKLKP